MQVLALTIFLSLNLAALFVVCFFWASRRTDGGSLEQDSLLPLRNDQIAKTPSPEKR